ncbi:MAG: hypothetical protein JXR88_03270, partial [Clostridia bacterium]|nr:hypothetical protein [Clostridia bacterium]
MKIIERYFGHVDEAIIIFSKSNYEITYMNLLAERFFDMDRKLMIGESIHKFIKLHDAYLNEPILTSSVVLSYVHDEMMTIQLFHFKSMDGDYIGCILNPMKKVELLDLHLQGKWPMGLVEIDSTMIHWVNFNKPLEVLFELDSVENPISYLDHQLTFE